MSTSALPGAVGDDMLSPQCRADGGHGRCDHLAAAWDHVLDRPVACGCPCHQPAARMSSWCREGRQHHVCRRIRTAWDHVSDRVADCVCPCH